MIIKCISDKPAPTTAGMPTKRNEQLSKHAARARIQKRYSDARTADDRRPELLALPPGEGIRVIGAPDVVDSPRRYPGPQSQAGFSIVRSLLTFPVFSVEAGSKSRTCASSSRPGGARFPRDDNEFAFLEPDVASRETPCENGL